MKRLAILLALLAGTAQAQWVAEDVDLGTAAGRITILDDSDGFSRQLQVGATRFFEDGFYRFVNIEAQRGALYLIGLSSGGTGCAAIYVWLHTETKPPRISNEFGNCSDLAEVRSDTEAVSVVMPLNDASEGFVAYVYDGKAIEKVSLVQNASGIGQNADDWVGRYPHEVFRDADWRDRLIALMGEDAYVAAGNVIATSSPFEVRGDWVVGTGFNNRLAGDAAGAIALNRNDGRVVVAIFTDAFGVQVWGDIGGTVPQGIHSILSRR